LVCPANLTGRSHLPKQGLRREVCVVVGVGCRHSDPPQIICSCPPSAIFEIKDRAIAKQLCHSARIGWAPATFSLTTGFLKSV